MEDDELAHEQVEVVESGKADRPAREAAQPEVLGGGLGEWDARERKGTAGGQAHSNGAGHHICTRGGHSSPGSHAVRKGARGEKGGLCFVLCADERAREV